MRLMCVGAHPDDCDIRTGGLALKCVADGGEALFVSLTNGNAGHHEMQPDALARRRKAEARRAGETLGVEYRVLDHDDGRLVASLEAREELIGLVRGFRPNLLLGPRPFDYHADHRAAGQLVMDASYLLTVPLIRPDVPIMERMPVIGYTSDRFQRPYPFSPDAVIGIDEEFDTKVDALACHESQVFEWIPFNGGYLDQVPEGHEERRRFIAERYGSRFRSVADRYREQLIVRYGSARGEKVDHAEAFEVCEYGRQPAADELGELFPD